MRQDTKMLSAKRLNHSYGELTTIASLDLESVGYWIVGLFVVTWVVALLIWRLGRIEERWSANLQTAD